MYGRMLLDPQAQALIDELEAEGCPDFAELTPEQARSHAQPKAPVSPAENDGVLVDRVLVDGPGESNLPLSFYYPDGQGDFPALVYFHGGGFVTGSVSAVDGLCRRLCQEARCCVVSVEYRLAPEHPFPAGVLDAYAALSYVHENADDHRIDHRRIALGGDSAGANLATVVARQSKERRGPILACQILFYPVTDLRSLDTHSYRKFASGPYLTRATMAWAREHYLPRVADRSDPSASPLAATNLIGMPSTFLVLAGCDPLRDEGAAYAELLQQVGTHVVLREFDGQMHGFVRYCDRLDAAACAISEAAAHMRGCFEELENDGA